MHTEENKKILARNIIRFRDAKGVTNQQLCRDLGFKYTTYVDWINAVTYPRIGKIEAMANYFGIQKSDLIEEKLTEGKEKDNDILSDIIVQMRMDDQFQRMIRYLHDFKSPIPAILSDIIVRLRKDDDFLELVQSLYVLDSDKFIGAKEILNAFTKQFKD